MKIVTALVAALVGVTGFSATAPAAAAPAAADAGQDRVVVRERTVVTPRATRTRVVVRDRRTTARRYGYGRHRQRVCTVRYRRGERIRTCRYVYRRY